MNKREELEKMEKEELIEALMYYGEEGYFPLELIFLKSKTTIAPNNLKNCWQSIYENAKDKDETDGEQAASLLMDGAELCFEKAKQFSNRTDTVSFCKQLVSDLYEASESEGIGMEWNHDWLYMEVAERVEEYLGNSIP